MNKFLTSLILLLSFTATIRGAGIKISGGEDFPLIFAGSGRHTLNIWYDADADAVVSVTIKHYGPKGGRIFEKRIAVPAGSETLNVQVAFPDNGFYEYSAAIADKRSGKSSASAESRIAVVPAGVEPVADMGVCTHFAQDKGSIPYSLELMTAAGFSTIRDEVYWGDVERERGVFSFPAKYDQYIDAAYSAGLEPLIILGYGNPKGDKSVERGFPVDDAGRKRFVDYTRELLQRYGDKVKYWELWNEPSPGHGIDPAKVYYPLLRDVYAAVREYCPDGQLIASAGQPNHIDGAFIRPILDAGGADYMDGYAMHTYVAPYNPEDGYETRGSACYKRASITEMWPEYGRISNKYKRENSLDAWVTEVGWHTADNLPWNGNSDTVNIDGLRQAAYATRLFLLSRRYGTVKKVYLYDFQNDGVNPDNREDNFGMITIDYQPKEGYQSIAVMASLIGNRPWTGTIAEDASTRAYIYGGEGDRVAALWSVNDYDAPLPGDERAKTITVNLDTKKVVYVDWQGVRTVLRSPSKSFTIPLSENPAYLLLD